MAQQLFKVSRNHSYAGRIRRRAHDRHGVERKDICRNAHTGVDDEGGRFHQVVLCCLALRAECKCHESEAGCQNC